MSAEIEAARHWLVKARNDLLTPDNNLRAKKIPLDAVCFHCQQAAEKLLKAYLVAKGQAYPISHDLPLILERVLRLQPEAERLREVLALLMPYAVEIRYPDEGRMPSRRDAEEARDAADQILNWLKGAMSELFKHHRGI